MVSNTPLVDVLSLLDLYSTSHTKASSSLKSTIWNISKARRQKGGLGVGFSISAFDVREELRAHATLECKCSHEPSLADEDSSEKECSGDSAVADDSFVLNFGCIPKAKESEKSNANAAIKTLDETGLRQRKGKEETSSSTNTWTEETHEDEMEEKLRKQDPIELFGALPPRELKLAQKNAKEMLQMYVNAANNAVEMLRIMEENTARK